MYIELGRILLKNSDTSTIQSILNSETLVSEDSLRDGPESLWITVGTIPYSANLRSYVIRAWRPFYDKTLYPR